MNIQECTRIQCWCKHVSLPQLGSLWQHRQGTSHRWSKPNYYKEIYRIDIDLYHQEMYLIEVFENTETSSYYHSRDESNEIPICFQDSIEKFNDNVERFHEAFKPFIIDEV